MNPTAHSLYCDQLDIIERATIDKVNQQCDDAGNSARYRADALRDVFWQEEKARRAVNRALIALEKYTSK